MIKPFFQIAKLASAGKNQSDGKANIDNDFA
jgi:hypothetical protein